jgi:glutamyl-tRNA synthetase
MIDPAAVGDPDHPEIARVRPAVALLKDRLETLADAPEHLGCFLVDQLPPYDPLTLIPKKGTSAETLAALEAVAGMLPDVDLDDEAAAEARFRALADELGTKAGSLFMPIRVAVTGRTQSPGLFETMRVIGKDRCVERVQQAIVALGETEMAAG